MGPGAGSLLMGPNYISDHHVIDIIQFISSHCYLSNLLNLTGQCLPNLTFHRPQSLGLVAISYH